MRAAAIILAVAGAAQAAAVLGGTEPEALAARADAVAVVRVLDTRVAWGAPGPSSGLLFTHAMVEIEESWKGEPARTVEVLLPGGSLGELTQTAQGMASLTRGERAVLFLRARAKARGGEPAVFQLVQGEAGKYRVAEGAAAAAEPMARARHGAPMPLRALRERVLRAIARRGGTR